MNSGRMLWAAGGYLAGTFPSTLLVARAKRATTLLASAGRDAGETDPHILMTKHLGVGWTAVAATADVVKGFGYMKAARHIGNLDTAWLALVGTAIVVGHSFPFYARRMAGRGLAAASGVFLAVLPWEMVVAGLIIVIGGATHNTGLSTTIGMGSVPIVSVILNRPGDLVAMGAAIFAVLIIRRLEGVGGVVRRGVSPARAVLYRCVFDSSEAPARPELRGLGEEDPHRP